MAELICEISRIEDLIPHPDPEVERLEMARVKGWYVMVRKGTFQPGDPCLYLAPDTVLTSELEQLWLDGSKFRLEGGRIRAIKFRNAISQGLIVGMSDVRKTYMSKGLSVSKLQVGYDVQKDLGITKYEPPDAPLNMRTGKGVTVSRKHPDFKEYTDIRHLRFFPNAIEPGEPVYISAKIHGSSTRFGHFAYRPTGLWGKFLKFIGLAPKHQFMFGSRRVQMTLDKAYKGFYSQTEGNIYRRIAVQYQDCLEPGEVLYGEIVGPGVQKGYHYGYKDGEIGFYAYDVMVNGEYLDPDGFIKFCQERGIPRVPCLYLGPYRPEAIDKMVSAKVCMNDQPIREGVVVKPMLNQNSPNGRRAFKVINPEYLLQDNTDFH